MNARDEILARVRAAQATGYIPGGQARGETQSEARPDPAQLLDRFRKELDALGVASHVEASDEEVRRRVAGLVEGKRVLAWDPAHLPYDVGSVLGTCIGPASPRDLQATAEIGVTGCAAAIADTGSLVLLSGPGRSRAVSLLPPAHLGIVRRSDLCASFGDFLLGAPEALAGSASCTVVTGPSRTADIELTLTLGVHGPGVVMVVIGP